jgi:hypothetical protein
MHTVFICNICSVESQLTSYSQEESYRINSQIGDASFRVQFKLTSNMYVQWKSSGSLLSISTEEIQGIAKVHSFIHC